MKGGSMIPCVVRIGLRHNVVCVQRRGMQHSYADSTGSRNPVVDGDGNQDSGHEKTFRGHLYRHATPIFRKRHYTFLDKMTFVAKGGDGAAGGIFWNSMPNTQGGGPAGGNGGTGGSVLGQCAPQYHSLHHLLDQGYIVFDPYNFDEATVGLCNAGNGTEGDRLGMGGNFGFNVTMPLPIGTVLVDADNNRELVELTRHGEKFEFAAGGKGGVGNRRLKTSIIQSPNYSELGHRGETRTYTLELRQFADIAFVGRANAGRSSLLGAISRAAPEPAAWAYTSWRPNIGHVHPDEESKFSVTDLPGLAAEAHLKEGREGADFLQHLFRVDAVVYCIDICSHVKGIHSPQSVPLEEVLDSLQQELEYFEEGFSHKAIAIAVTKMDILVDPITRAETWKKMEEFQKKTNLPVFPVSSHTKKGVLDLVLYMSKMIKKRTVDKEHAEAERTRKMRKESRLLDEIRLAETKQIIIQRMQDFHMSRAVETLLEERIRGRPNYSETERANIELARERAQHATGVSDREEETDNVDSDSVRLDDIETDDLEPYVNMDNIEDAVQAEQPEDWSVGDMTDLGDSVRTQKITQGELWSPLSIHQDAIATQRDVEERDIFETYKTLAASEREMSRDEYTKDLVGRGSVESLAHLDVDELASRQNERDASIRLALKEGTRLPVQPTLETPFLEVTHSPLLEEDTQDKLPAGQMQTETEDVPTEEPTIIDVAAENIVTVENQPQEVPPSHAALLGIFETEEYNMRNAHSEKAAREYRDEMADVQRHRPTAEERADVKKHGYKLFGGSDPAAMERIAATHKSRERAAGSYADGAAPIHPERRAKAHEAEMIYEKPAILSATQRALQEAVDSESAAKMRKKLKSMPNFYDTPATRGKAGFSQGELDSIREGSESILKASVSELPLGYRSQKPSISGYKKDD